MRLFKISWFLHSFGVFQQIPHNYSKKRWISVIIGMETRNRYKLKVRKSWVTYPYRFLDTLESSGGGAKVPHPLWNRVKPFLTSKGCMSNDFISIKNWDAFIDKESELVKRFNTHYINIEKKTSGVPLKSYVIDTNSTQEITEGIIRKYKRHPSILKIKNNFNSSNTFDFRKA